MSGSVDGKSRAVSHSLWAALAVVLTLVVVAGGAFAIGWGSADHTTKPSISNSAATQSGHYGPMMSWARSHPDDMAWMRGHMGDVKWMRHHDGQWRWIQTHAPMWTWMRGHWDDMARIHNRWERWYDPPTGANRGRSDRDAGRRGGDWHCW